MPITEITIRTDNGKEIEHHEQQLYLLSELKALHDRPASEQDEAITSGALDEALQWMGQVQAEFFDPMEEMDSYIQPEHFGLAGITFDPKKVEYTYGYGSPRSFVLPRSTTVDVPKFLVAMKAYWEGRDYRGRDYRKATSKLVASERGRHTIDLRSRDARIAKEQGLTVYKTDGLWGRSSTTEQFDPDWDAQFTDRFREDANEFLFELCSEAAKIIDDEYEYVTSDQEYLIEGADINEYLFTRSGKRA